MPIRNLNVPTLLVTVMVVIDALWNPLVLGSAYAAPALFQTYVFPYAQAVDGSSFIFKFATMIAFAVWIYIAGRNLVAAGFQQLEFTAGARIWWFFVPVASLFKPFQGMRELWNASHDIWPYDTNDTIVSLWWALWLARSVVSVFLQIAARSNGGGNGAGAIWAISVVYMASAVVGIVLIRRIAAAQRHLDGSRLDEVFA